MATFTESWLTGPSNTQFYTRTYANSSPTALLVFIHGFIEHIGRYEHIHPAFAARGIAVFAFDQRGFGRTACDVEHKSKESAYAKTTHGEQVGDIEWALGHARGAFPGVPTFLMGHSMGGALVLAFPTQSNTPLAGVIATSPLLAQAHPVPRATRWVGGKLGTIVPSLTIPAAVKAEDISHDKSVCQAYLKDPLIKQVGTLAGVSTMLDSGDHLLREDYKKWPSGLPLLLIHGTADKVTSHKASEAFFASLSASDKTLSLYPDGFHELQNEPDGVKEKLVDECVAWVLARVTGTGVDSTNGTGAKL